MRTVRATAVALICAASGCASVPPPPAAPVPPTLDATVGFRDPTHAGAKHASAPLELTSQVAAPSARFKGTLAIDLAPIGPLAPGETRSVLYALKPLTDGETPAAIHTLRVAGFERVGVGLEQHFVVPATMVELGASLAAGIGLGILDLLAGPPTKSPSPAAPTLLSLDVPRGHQGVGELRVVIPEDTPPGHYQGQLVAEGNFAPVSFPLEVEVVPYEDRVDALLAGMDAPEAKVPAAAAVASAAARGEDSVSFDLPDVASGWIQAEGGWGRWLIAGTGIWDLGALQWFGPVTDPADTGPSYAKAIAGPRRAPLLFYLNHGDSLDVISIRDRRTLDRLTGPKGALNGALFRVSPDGDRILVACGDDLCFFQKEGDRWTRRVLPSPCPFPTSCAWREPDPNVRELFVGTGPEEMFATRKWRALVHYDLSTGRRTEVALDQVCTAHAYSAARGMVVCVAGGEEAADALEIVRTRDLSVARFAVTPTQVDDVAIGDGEVFLRHVGGACLDVSLTSPIASHPCAGDPFAVPPRVAGTAIAYEAAIHRVTYKAAQGDAHRAR